MSYSIPMAMEWQGVKWRSTCQLAGHPQPLAVSLQGPSCPPAADQGYPRWHRANWEPVLAVEAPLSARLA